MLRLHNLTQRGARPGACTEYGAPYNYNAGAIPTGVFSFRLSRPYTSLPIDMDTWLKESTEHTSHWKPRELCA